MLTIKEILKSTGGRLIKGKITNRISGVSIDSRTIKQNELFVAIKGRRFDGHSFIEQAIFRGAGAIIFSNSHVRVPTSIFKAPNVISMVRVKDTVYALGALAYYHRRRFKIPVIAITGSNGKTTTKEMLSSILARRFNVLSTVGTQNNHLGVPLSILKLRQRHNFAVIEIGANHTGEIDKLSWMIKPTVGIITNIGPSHLEFFKSLKGVYKAKIELIKNLAKNGKLIINKDDRFLSQLNNAKFQTITFGFNRRSDFYGQIVKQTESRTFFLLNARHRLMLRTLGRHNVYNALASIACARAFSISYSEIKDALRSFQAPSMRMQLFDIKDIKIINDCYNSNPESLKWALELLREYKSFGKKIIVCGDMLELGRQAEKLHSDIGKKIVRAKIDFLITVGPLSRNIAQGAHLAGMPRNSIRTYYNTAKAAKFLCRFTHAGDVVLIKGSRAMQMEDVAECFTNSSIH